MIRFAPLSATFCDLSQHERLNVCDKVRLEQLQRRVRQSVRFSGSCVSRSSWTGQCSSRSKLDFVVTSGISNLFSKPWIKKGYSMCMSFPKGIRRYPVCSAAADRFAQMLMCFVDLPSNLGYVKLNFKRPWYTHPLRKLFRKWPLEGIMCQSSYPTTSSWHRREARHLTLCAAGTTSGQCMGLCVSSAIYFDSKILPAWSVFDSKSWAKIS